MGRCDRGRLEDVRDSVIVLFCFIYVVFFFIIHVFIIFNKCYVRSCLWDIG